MNVVAYNRYSLIGDNAFKKHGGIFSTPLKLG